MKRKAEIGVYRHFEGGTYEVVGTAVHTEDNQLLVIYYNLEGDFRCLWATPLPMFLNDRVEVEGRMVPRFELLDDYVERTTSANDKALYDRYVKYMSDTFGPMQGNPPTLPLTEFLEMTKTNKFFAKKFGGKTIEPD